MGLVWQHGVVNGKVLWCAVDAWMVCWEEVVGVNWEFTLCVHSLGGSHARESYVRRYEVGAEKGSFLE